jgi:hypothetical protein
VTARDIVWIPSVPLPLLGWRADTCQCGAKFRGKGRRARYELHWRREHEPDDPGFSQMGVSRVEAQRIYAAVRGEV